MEEKFSVFANSENIKGTQIFNRKYKTTFEYIAITESEDKNIFTYWTKNLNDIYFILMRKCQDNPESLNWQKVEKRLIELKNDPVSGDVVENAVGIDIKDPNSVVSLGIDIFYNVMEGFYILNYAMDSSKIEELKFK